MKILITGNMGYVGGAVVRHLRHVVPNAHLTGYDSGFFANCFSNAAYLPEILLDQQIFGDIRDISPDALQGQDAVIHLAAVSNDPMGNRFEGVTEKINQDATLRLAEISRSAGIKNFVFASSCSVYGAAEGPARKEGDSLNPLTAYARSKVSAEIGLQKITTDSMITTCLRFATACGMSDRLRLDLVVNDFVACAITAKEITVLSDGTPWRPLINITDMARAIEWASMRPATNGGAYLSVNAGANAWNFQVRDLAQAVAFEVAGTRISINANAPPDKRSYQVDFGLFRTLAPQHQPLAQISDTIAKLRDGLVAMHFNNSDFRSSEYVRLFMLDKHIVAKRLGMDLRWRRGEITGQAVTTT